MNKKQNLLAIALSASFVLAGANVAEANEDANVPIQNIGEANIGDTNIENKPDQEKSDANLPRSEENITGSDTDQGQVREIGQPIIEEPTKHIVRVGTKPLEGTRENVVDKSIPYETKVIYDENLEAGNRIVDNEGKDGKERVTTTITSKDGDIEYNSEGIVLTPKEDRIVRVGVKPVVKEEAILFDTSYTHNPELKVGEVKKISDGTPGKVIVTTSFNKETGELETSVTRTEPTNAEYEYGSLTEGSFTVESEIPFNVKVIEDDTLDAGTNVVDKEGVAGKKETTVKVKNSKEESREENVITEAVDKIIRVGTKPTENMCPVPETPEEPSTPEKPGEEDPTDPEKPGEEDPTDPEEPGEEDPIDPEKPGEEDPEEPGEEDPIDPEKPGEEDPEEPSTPDKPEKPEEPGTPGERPEIPGRPETPENSAQAEIEKNVAKKSTNPKTGIGSVATIFTSMGISIAGLMATTKKKKEDE